MMKQTLMLILIATLISHTPQSNTALVSKKRPSTPLHIPRRPSQEELLQKTITQTTLPQDKSPLSDQSWERIKREYALLQAQCFHRKK